MDTEKRDERIIKVLDGTATPAEMLEVARWVEERPENGRYFEQMKKAWNLTSGVVPSSEREERELRRYLRYIREARRRRTWRSVWRYAAVLAIPLCLAAYGVREWMREEERPAVVARVEPGGYKAELIMDDGTAVALLPGGERRIEVEPGMVATNEGGGIVYRDGGERKAADEPVWMNTLRTPRGGEYGVTLADGTVVRLNAASELRYPVTFTGGHREVYLSGEAYFEVATDSARPFVVNAGAARVRAYGTEFNVNAYPGAGTRAVLVEGSVGVSGVESPEERMLRPSQLAVYDGRGELQEVRDVDVFPYIAWKEGQFVFTDENLERILEVLSRWYDVDVEWRDEAVKALHFTGHIRKYDDIEVILNAINRMVGTRLRVEGQTVVVTR